MESKVVLLIKKEIVFFSKGFLTSIKKFWKSLVSLFKAIGMFIVAVLAIALSAVMYVLAVAGVYVIGQLLSVYDWILSKLSKRTLLNILLLILAVSILAISILADKAVTNYKFEQQQIQDSIRFQHYVDSTGLDLDALADALIWIESRGNDSAVSSMSSASGPLQQLKVYVDDVNRILKLKGLSSRYSYDDRFDRVKAIEMFKIIQNFYNPEGDIEKACVMHRGDNIQAYNEMAISLYNKNVEDKFWSQYHF